MVVRTVDAGRRDGVSGVRGRGTHGDGPWGHHRAGQSETGPPPGRGARMSATFRGWVYAEAGDYHRNLDPNWSYTPTYLRKMATVRQVVGGLPAGARILDAGCGEGVLVEEFRSVGRIVEGIDLNYESDTVRRGSVLALPYPDGSFDCVLFLDVFEHLAFADQPRALLEIRRVLRPGGTLVASIPNLAHWNSRVRMALRGELDRSDVETEHVGERTFGENRRQLVDAGFRVTRTTGITLTVPFLYRSVICRRPARMRWLHDLLQVVAVPSLSMVNVFVCERP